jgi:hypothetical protein
MVLLGYARVSTQDQNWAAASWRPSRPLESIRSIVKGAGVRFGRKPKLSPLQRAQGRQAAGCRRDLGFDRQVLCS